MKHPIVVSLAATGVVLAGLVLAFGWRPAPPIASTVGQVHQPASQTATPIPVVAGAATTAPGSAEGSPAAAGAGSAPSSRQASAGTPSIAASSATPTPAPRPAAKLSLSINGVITTFAVTLNGATDACTILTLAKNQGYLKSVTLDNSYINTLHSAYVREINGYKNNWTFKVNGTSPKGCSLATINKGDTVTWTYQ